METVIFILRKIRALPPEKQARWRQSSARDIRRRRLKREIAASWCAEGLGL